MTFIPAPRKVGNVWYVFVARRLRYWTRKPTPAQVAKAVREYTAMVHPA